MKSIAVVALCMFAAAAGEAEADASANPLPLSPCACSPPLLARLKHLLMLAITMVTMDIHMPVMDTTMARGPLMLSLLLMLPMDTTDTDTTLDMPTMDTTDTHMPAVDTSMDKMDIIIKFLVTKI